MDVLSDWWRRFREASRSLWATVTWFSIAGILLALLANRFAPIVPSEYKLSLAAGSVGSLLSILASSMLAVTTFSLSIVRSSYSAAANNATPRATQLLVDDSVTKDTLGTFVGSFLFSVFGIVGLSADLYNEKGRVILFGATLLVIVLVTYRLVRWISVTTRMGRLDDTLSRIEKAATEGLTAWRDQPRLGCAPPVKRDGKSSPILATGSGRIFFIDFQALQDLAEDWNGRVLLTLQPGAQVHEDMEIGRFYCDDPAGECPDVEELRQRAVACIDLKRRRNFQIDPYAGLIALSEVASRALSPAVNDPGTAADVLECGLRCFETFLAAGCQEGDDTQDSGEDCADKPDYPRVHMADVDFGGLLRLFFDPIARDGASVIEVQVPLQRALLVISEQVSEDRQAAVKERIRVCIGRANDGLSNAEDRELLAQIAGSGQERYANQM